MSAHARLAPSSLYTLSKCAASLQLKELLGPDRLIQDEYVDEAAEGTAAHWLIEQAVRVGIDWINYDMATGGVSITPEMVEGAKLWIDELPCNPITWHIESRVDCSVIHPQCWGTPDFWALDEDGATLVVCDYKFGRRPVDAYENSQLLAYALGIVSQRPEVKRVMFKIVQPRDYANKVKTWIISADKLMSYLPVLQDVCLQALSEEPKLTPGRHCRNCEARLQCSAFKTSVELIGDIIKRELPPDLPIAEVEEEYRLACEFEAMVGAWVSGLKQQLITYGTSGQKLSQYMLVQGYGNQRWTLKTEQLKDWEKLFNIKLLKETAITPKQAISAGIPADLVNPQTTIPKGELKLVPIGTKLKRIFNNDN